MYEQTTLDTLSGGQIEKLISLVKKERAFYTTLAEKEDAPQDLRDGSYYLACTKAASEYQLTLTLWNRELGPCGMTQYMEGLYKDQVALIKNVQLLQNEL